MVNRKLYNHLMKSFSASYNHIIHHEIDHGGRKCYHINCENKTPEDISGYLCQAYQGKYQISEIESLVKTLGGEVREGDGSRVVLELSGMREYAHRPHPGKEAKNDKGVNDKGVKSAFDSCA